MEIRSDKKSSSSFLDSLEFIERGQGTPPYIPQKPPLEMDISTSSPKTPPETNKDMPQPIESTETHRATSSQRLKYEAEVSLIKSRFGDLETMRKKLNLSQRKMAQLLMVDPSAWTRWTREDGQAPPHIYRSLSWFLLLQEKEPATNPYQWLTSVSQPRMPEREISALKEKIGADLEVRLENQIRDRWMNRRPETNGKLWKWLFLGQALLFFTLLLMYSRR
jgi:transcriptional regulator with XRE-family HTH domain